MRTIPEIEKITQEVNKGYIDTETALAMAYGVGYDKGWKDRTNNKERQRAVFQIKSGRIIKKYESGAEAARSVKRNRAAIMRAAKGQSAHCAGYQWKYMDEIGKIK